MTMVTLRPPICLIYPKQSILSRYSFLAHLFSNTVRHHAERLLIVFVNSVWEDSQQKGRFC